MNTEGGIRHGSITRWRYLIARKPCSGDWQDYLADFWEMYRDLVVERHIKLWPRTRPARWWQYDAPEPLRSGESEYEYLRRHRLLTAAEKSHGSRRRAS
jgi:hypothetical protein